MLSIKAPTQLRAADLRVPGDKSISHRSLILAALAQGESRITGLSDGEDVNRTREALISLGVSIQTALDGTVIVNGKGAQAFSSPADPINCGNSGTTARLLTGLLAAIPGLVVEVHGDASLSKRPMDRVVHPLQAMGAKISFLDQPNCLPMRIEGQQLHELEYTVPVASAQVKSALLLASMFASGRSSIHEATPTRDHTEYMLRAMGAKLISMEEGEGFRHLIEAGPLDATDFEIPGDMSSAAYFLTLSALLHCTGLVIRNVNLNPRRSGMLETLKSLGMRFEITLREDTIEPCGDVHFVDSFSLDRTFPPVKLGTLPSMIDEMPLLAVVATQLPTNVRIMGASELRLKEADRIAAMCDGLKAMGARIKEHRDGWETLGGTPLKGAEVDGCHDHRVVMSLAVAACLARGETRIKGADWVKISYPGFWDALRECGVEVREQPDE